MRKIQPGELFDGSRVRLRLCTLEDCGDRYVGWLNDAEVNTYLETRHSEQTLESIRAFVLSMLESPNNYLFALLDKEDDAHVGNMKIGPIHERYGHADVSYFVGERSRWGRGLTTSALRVAARIAKERLGLFRLEAGLYESNAGSAKALEKVGFRREGVLRQRLVRNGVREDHLLYGLLLD